MNQTTVSNTAASSGRLMKKPLRVDSLRAQHDKLLSRSPQEDDWNELKQAPIFTGQVRQHLISDLPSSGSKITSGPYSQFGLLGGDVFDGNNCSNADRRIFYNISVPSSVFICGSQGSGKSHTLACLLENCLIQSDANQLQHPLSGIVFHYDTFVSDNGASPCEAAYLSSHKGITVRVLVPPSNYRNMKVL